MEVSNLLLIFYWELNSNSHKNSVMLINIKYISEIFSKSETILIVAIFVSQDIIEEFCDVVIPLSWVI